MLQIGLNHMANKLPIKTINGLDSMIRVDHAGEYGAKRIYEGQMAYIKDKKVKNEIEHMYKQELKHLEYFSKIIPEYKVRPSILHPLWHIAGYVLGAATATMGTKAAMICTEAVEEVIDEHYREQITQLHDHPDLQNKLEEFRQEELEHKNTASKYKGKKIAPHYVALSEIIKSGCRAAIFLAKRF